MNCGRSGRTNGKQQGQRGGGSLALVAWALTGVAGATVACTGDAFDSCLEKRTCGVQGESGAGGEDGERGGSAGDTAGSPGSPDDGSGGEGAAGEGAAGEGAAGQVAGEGGGTSRGEAGMAGVAGTAPEPECEADADCSDGLYCTGVEVCVDGACLTEDVPCLGAREHCSVECVEEQESCAVSAVDNDRDGHGAAACAEAPGDDCDDEAATVHPGASELCDGRDNDCNGLSDLSDGHGLGGTTRVHATARNVDVAWSPESQTFGVVHVGSGMDDGSVVSTIEFATLLPSGVVAAPLTTLAGPTRGMAFRDPAIAWGTDRFGVVFTRESTGGYHRFFVPVTAGGEPGESTDTPGSVYDIASQSSGDWVFAGKEPPESANGHIQIESATAAGVLTPLATIAARASDMRIASGGGRIALVWVDQDTPVIEWAGSNGIGVPMPTQVTGEGQHPDVLVTPTGYALAWASAEGVHFATADADGGLTCVPRLVPVGSMLADTDAVSLAALGDTVLALSTDESGRVELLRFDAECRLLDRALVTDAAETPSRPRLAVGGGFVALAWSDTAAPGSTDTRARTRLLTELLCE